MRQRFTAWRVILCAVIGAVAVAVAQNKVVPCIPVLGAEVEISKSEMGWLSSVFNVAGILIAFPAVWIVDWIGAKAACLLSVGFGAAGTMIGLFSSGYTAILAGRIVEGIGAGLISIAVPNLIHMWFPKEKRGLPTGIWTSWQYIGQAVCFFFGTAVAYRYGWKFVWLLGLLFLCVGGILSFMFVKERPIDQKKSSKKGREVSPTEVFSSLKNRNAWLITLAIFAFCFVSFGFVTWIPSCWTENIGIGSVQANQYVSVFALISILMVLAAGWILDRVCQKSFCILMFLGYAFIVAGAFFLSSEREVQIFVILYAFLESAVITALWTIMPGTARNRQETDSVIALLTAGSNVGMLTGPPAIGFCVSQIGWITTAFVLGVISVLGGVCVLAVKQ